MKTNPASSIAKVRDQNIWKALIWMVISGIGFSSMSVFVKKLSGQVPTFQIIFFRVFINFLLISGVALYQKPILFPEGKRILVLRGVAGFISLSCLFFALGNLPLPIAGVLNWSSILFVIIFSALFLNEKLPARGLFWVALAFTGLIILLNPSSEVVQARGPTFWIWAGVALLGAMFGAIAYVTVRAATAKYSSTLVILYFTAIGTFLALPLARFDLSWPSSEFFGYILIMSASAALGQYGMTEGYRHAKAGVVSTMSLMNSGMTALLGGLLFQEYLSTLQWIGMFLIVLGILFTTRTSQRA